MDEQTTGPAAPARTAMEILRYIVKYADRIPVLGEVDGKVGNFFLTQLPEDQLLDHMTRFVRLGRLPHRVLTQEERGNT